MLAASAFAVRVPVETKFPSKLTVEVADPKLMVFAPVAAAWILRLPVLEAALQSDTAPDVAVS